MIIITHGRKELVRRQKACMDYVNRGILNGKDPKEKGLQEAVTDFQRWSKESGQFKGREPGEKGMKWVTSYEWKQKEKNGKETKKEG